MATTTSRDVTLFSLGVLAAAVGLQIVAAMSKKGPPPIREPGVKAWRMSKFVKHGGIVRTQGICGDFKNMPSSTAVQTKEALDKLDAILIKAGVTRAHLLSITIFIADISPANFDEMNEVYDKWIDPDNKPTRLCVQAGINHGAAVEFRAEAYYDE